MSSEQQIVPSGFDTVRGVTGGEVIDVSAANWTSTKWTKGITLDADGAVKVRMHDNSDDTYAALKAGVFYPFQGLKIVYSTGTSPQTGIHILY